MTPLIAAQDVTTGRTRSQRYLYIFSLSGWVYEYSILLLKAGCSRPFYLIGQVYSTAVHVIYNVRMTGINYNIVRNWFKFPNMNKADTQDHIIHTYCRCKVFQKESGVVDMWRKIYFIPYIIRENFTNGIHFIIQELSYAKQWWWWMLCSEPSLWHDGQMSKMNWWWFPHCLPLGKYGVLRTGTSLKRARNYKLPKFFCIWGLLNSNINPGPLDCNAARVPTHLTRSRGRQYR